MVRFVTTNKGNAVYNASDVGLGKSAMTIETLNRLGNPRTLIVCPSVVKLNWGDELEKWWKGRDAEILFFNKGSDLKHVSKHHDICVISYDLLRQKKIADALAALRFESLVLDEAHYVKNPNALRTHSTLRVVWPSVSHRYCLSATPFTTSVADCYTTFSRCAPGLFGSYYDFIDNFVETEETPWGIKHVGLKNPEILSKLIRHHFFLRLLADDPEVKLELPEVLWTQIKLPHKEYAVKLTKEEKEAHAKYVEELRAAIARGDQSIPHPPKAVASVRRELGLKKVSAVVEFVKNLLDSGTPTVIYFWHLDCIQSFVFSLGKTYNPYIIDGSKSETERYAAIEAFQSGETDCLVCQIKAAGVGINLTRCRAVVFGEISGSPADIKQALGRARRQGNKADSLLVYYFVTERTVEEETEATIISRAKDFKEAIDGS